MKTKIFLWLFLILAVCVVLLAVYKSRVKPVRGQDLEAKAVMATNPAAPIAFGNPVVQQLPVNVANSASDIAAKYKQGSIGKDEAMQDLLMEENKKPLDIYGRIIDQYNNPVVGAKVEGSILLNGDFVHSGGEAHFTETDSSGQFSFIGIHGVKLGIRPQKAGYIFDLKSVLQRPDDYQPDSNNPVILTMWRTRGAESLVSFSISSTIPYDGTPATFDIATQAKNPNGDLRVTFTRSPLEVRRGRDKYDSYIKIEMLQGGLISENDLYPYWAPSVGYSRFLEFNISSNSVPWIPGFTQNFYFINAHGQFGRMMVDINSALTPVRVTFDGTLNPSGSQNLEPSTSP